MRVEKPQCRHSWRQPKIRAVIRESNVRSKVCNHCEEQICEGRGAGLPFVNW